MGLSDLAVQDAEKVDDFNGEKLSVPGLLHGLASHPNGSWGGLGHPT